MSFRTRLRLIWQMLGMACEDVFIWFAENRGDNAFGLSACFVSFLLLVLPILCVVGHWVIGVSLTMVFSLPFLVAAVGALRRWYGSLVRRLS